MADAVKLEQASVLDEYKCFTVLGSGAFGVVVGARRAKGRSEGALPHRVALKLVPVIDDSNDLSERKRELVAANTLTESGDVAHVVVAKRALLHENCHSELGGISRGEVARILGADDAKCLHRWIRALSVNNWRHLLAFEMDVAQGSVRSCLQQWGQCYDDTPYRLACMPEGLADQWALDTCHGARALHACGLAHRDLKPDNLLVFYHGARLPVVKISDFGSTAQVVTLKTVVVCTLWYRAPEVLRQQSYTELMDIWSISCIFAALLRGLPLFLKRSELEMLEAIEDMVPECRSLASGDSLLTRSKFAMPTQEELEAPQQRDLRPGKDDGITGPAAVFGQGKFGRLMGAHASAAQMRIASSMLQVSSSKRTDS